MNNPTVWWGWQNRDSSEALSVHMQQHTGVPPIIMQQAQPAFMHPMMQSQHA
jgi:hypothetical protein